jgi:hypothetical protein
MIHESSHPNVDIPESSLPSFILDEAGIEEVFVIGEGEGATPFEALLAGEHTPSGASGSGKQVL